MLTVVGWRSLVGLPAGLESHSNAEVRPDGAVCIMRAFVSVGRVKEDRQGSRPFAGGPWARRLDNRRLDVEPSISRAPADTDHRLRLRAAFSDSRVTTLVPFPSRSPRHEVRPLRPRPYWDLQPNRVRVY